MTTKTPDPYPTTKKGDKAHDDRKDKQPQLPNNVRKNEKRNGKKKSKTSDPDREWRMWGDI